MRAPHPLLDIPAALARHMPIAGYSLAGRAPASTALTALALVTAWESRPPSCWSHSFPTSSSASLPRPVAMLQAAALRIARALTGRSKIIKMEGSYHGSAAAFFVNVLFPRTLYPRLAVLGESLASGLRSISPRLSMRGVGPMQHLAVDEPAGPVALHPRPPGRQLPGLPGAGRPTPAPRDQCPRGQGALLYFRVPRRSRYRRYNRGLPPRRGGARFMSGAAL